MRSREGEKHESSQYGPTASYSAGSPRPECHARVGPSNSPGVLCSAGLSKSSAQKQINSMTLNAITVMTSQKVAPAGKRWV